MTTLSLAERIDNMASIPKHWKARKECDAILADVRELEAAGKRLVDVLGSAHDSADGSIRIPALTAKRFIASLAGFEAILTKTGAIK